MIDKKLLKTIPFRKDFPVERIRLKKKGLTEREINKLIKDEKHNL